MYQIVHTCLLFILYLKDRIVDTIFVFNKIVNEILLSFRYYYIIALPTHYIHQYYTLSRICELSLKNKRFQGILFKMFMGPLTAAGSSSRASSQDTRSNMYMNYDI